MLIIITNKNTASISNITVLSFSSLPLSIILLTRIVDNNQHTNDNDTPIPCIGNIKVLFPSTGNYQSWYEKCCQYIRNIIQVLFPALATIDLTVNVVPSLAELSVTPTLNIGVALSMGFAEAPRYCHLYWYWSRVWEVVLVKTVMHCKASKPLTWHDDRSWLTTGALLLRHVRELPPSQSDQGGQSPNW